MGFEGKLPLNHCTLLNKPDYKLTVMLNHVHWMFPHHSTPPRSRA
ncbi:hypothetical protein ABID21_003886 [Pseudorhizobium tarimense]|uniref:Transposase n=1 Tax=Pseudorhizobium tarimense TaxID=1079109 RepID=A0ABV2HB32_9HYPH